MVNIRDISLNQKGRVRNVKKRKREKEKKKKKERKRSNQKNHGEELVYI